MTKPKEWRPEEGVDLTSAVYQAVGSASMAWAKTPTGVFDESWARAVSEGLLAWLHEHYHLVPKADPGCWCWTCHMTRASQIEDFVSRLSFLSRMIVCPECGNKRCPRATHHDNTCTGSNEPGQPGSRYVELS